MRNLFTNASPHVHAGSARSGVASRARTLQIVNGSAWITIEGEPDDYWLSSGDTLELRPGRLVVVEADGTDVALNLGPTTPSGLVAVAAGAAQRAWRSLQLAVRRPIRECTAAVDTACRKQLSSSGWRRLGHL